MRIAVIGLLLFPTMLCAQVQALEEWWIDTGETDSTSLGTSVAALGDLNQDGFDDFIVGSGEEKAFIYFGSAQPDTIPDIIIPSPDISLSLFARSVYAIGDINSDGGEDFAAYAVVSQDPDHCRAYLYFGGFAMDSIPDMVLDGTVLSESNFGGKGFGIGDFNGDGGNDFVILDYAYDMIYPDPGGRVYIYFGGTALDSMADWQISGGNPFPQVGWDGAALGDINEDGFDDLALSEGPCVGLQGELHVGYVSVYQGSADPDTLPDLVIWGEGEVSELGKSVAGIDFNRDGTKDIVAGSSYDYPPNYSSSVYVYLLPSREPYVPDFIFPDQGYVGGSTGQGLLGIDLNGDGWQDVVSNNPSNSLGAGKSYAYLGGVYADTLLDAIYFQGHTQCALGSGAANVGDINGDGIEDLVIGEPGYNYFVYGSLWGRIYAILGDTIYHQSVGVAPQETTSPIPSAMQLSIYPIPANPFVVASFELRVASNMSLDIFDICGRRIAELASGFHLPGECRFVWDAGDKAAGMYFIRLRAGEEKLVEKVVMIK